MDGPRRRNPIGLLVSKSCGEKRSIGRQLLKIDDLAEWRSSREEDGGECRGEKDRESLGSPLLTEFIC